jgi:hypothetical protein
LKVKSSLRRRLWNLLVVFATGSALVLAALYYWRSKPVFRLGGTIDTPPLAVFFNPFRDRSPEHAADRWLNGSRTERWALNFFPEERARIGMFTEQKGKQTYVSGFVTTNPYKRK